MKRRREKKKQRKQTCSTMMTMATAEMKPEAIAFDKMESKNPRRRMPAKKAKIPTKKAMV